MFVQKVEFSLSLSLSSFVKWFKCAMFIAIFAYVKNIFFVTEENTKTAAVDFLDISLLLLVLSEVRLICHDDYTGNEFMFHLNLDSICDFMFANAHHASPCLCGPRASCRPSPSAASRWPRWGPGSGRTRGSRSSARTWGIWARGERANFTGLVPGCF